MATPMSFPHAAFLDRLERGDAAVATLPPLQAAEGGRSGIGEALLQLLIAQRTVWRADRDIALVADELRRYQKFAPPGRPSLQIVQLRRQQSQVRQALRVARQSFIRSADRFVRSAGLEVPPRLGLVAFVERWLQAQLPREAE